MSTDKKTFTTVGQGVEHLDLYKWANLDVTAEKLYNLRGNGYAAGLSSKRHNMVLSTEDGRPWQIEVLDPENEVDEELQIALERMFTVPHVDYWSKLHMAFDDTDWYGMGILNPVWEKQDGEIMLTGLRHLPAHTFDTLPSGYKLYSQILQGVTKNPESGATEFWQRPDASRKTPDKLDASSLFTVKNPACGELAGEAFMLPLFPFFSMLEYCHNTQMQLVHRLGVPPIFPKLTGPAQPASDANGNKGDLEYMEEMGMYYGKDSVYPLRENMTIETLQTRDSNIIGEIIDQLHKIIIDSSSASSFVSKDGTLIGGSDKQAGNLMNMYINGTRTWLAGSFNQLLQYYLDANGYEGYKAYFKVPLLSEDQADVRLREAEIGVKYWALDYNEVRERLKAEGLDEESIQKIIEFWRANQPVQQPLGMPGFTGTTEAVPETHAPGGTLSGATGKLVEDTYGDLSKNLKSLEDDIIKALEEEHGHQDHEHGGVGE